MARRLRLQADIPVGNSRRHACKEASCPWTARLFLLRWPILASGAGTRAEEASRRALSRLLLGKAKQRPCRRPANGSYGDFSRTRQPNPCLNVQDGRKGHFRRLCVRVIVGMTARAVAVRTPCCKLGEPAAFFASRERSAPRQTQSGGMPAGRVCSVRGYLRQPSERRLPSVAGPRLLALRRFSMRDGLRACVAGMQCLAQVVRSEQMWAVRWAGQQGTHWCLPASDWKSRAGRQASRPSSPVWHS